MGEQKTERRAAQNNDEINNLAEFKNHAFFPRFFFSIIVIYFIIFVSAFIALVTFLFYLVKHFNEPVH